MLLYPLLSILWAGSAIAKNSPMVPGWAINEQLMKNGHYVFTTVLEHQKTETSMEPNIRDDRLVTLAKTAYEDLDKVISNYDGFSWYKKPTLVAALQKNSKIYIASTIMRDSSHGVWNPAKAIPSALRRAIYQCQVVILPGVGDHSPSNCAEAMALYLYFAENKSTKESDDRMSDATVSGLYIIPSPVRIFFCPLLALYFLLEIAANLGL